MHSAQFGRRIAQGWMRNIKLNMQQFPEGFKYFNF
jgi:hypothetical protein